MSTTGLNLCLSRRKIGKTEGILFVQMTRLARGFLPMEKMMEMASCRLQEVTMVT